MLLWEREWVWVLWDSEGVLVRLNSRESKWGLYEVLIEWSGQDSMIGQKEGGRQGKIDQYIKDS